MKEVFAAFFKPYTFSVTEAKTTTTLFAAKASTRGIANAREVVTTIEIRSAVRITKAQTIG